MSIATLILGESGTGKSTSLRNLDPKKTLLIQSIHKPLPFRPKGWQIFDGKKGNIFVTDNADEICHYMAKTRRDIIVIDDYQYIMANEFMRRGTEKGYDKFTDIGVNAWKVCDLATKLPPNKRVYILAHTQSDDFGRVKIKTIGKMLDEKITLEGMFTICLRTQVKDGMYQFTTQNNGSDTVKSPMGLFEHPVIDNDLAEIDRIICDYYSISPTEQQSTTEKTSEHPTEPTGEN
ncbi:ATP-binding protein [Pasteurella caecimuris]|uniref:ATP-binding protein n=1 Tax=Rodentibacter caecimuris TaxID=1796644 RepID=UPI00214FEBEF|nr:ATP-binding protein [Pasteurella caecimuris]MCR1838709.1 ATP-binding protein [Pasteurella caecimuris]MCU0108155.1 ATP-binding protein [Pasteurella caecimuris]